MKKLELSILMILGLLFLSGCYQWISNSEVTGTILAVNYTELEATVDFQPEGYQEGKLGQWSKRVYN